MSTYTLEEILVEWKVGKLTAEQAFGQILQFLLTIERQVAELDQLVGLLLPQEQDRRYNIAAQM